MRRLISVIGILCIMLGVAYAEVDSQSEKKDLKKQYLYQWTDNQGNVHIADGLGKVPEQYRSQARKMETRKGEEPTPEQSGTSLSSPDINDDAAKWQWQQRVRDWKKRLADAENRYQELDRERSELFRAWGSPALAPVENRVRAEQIEAQMKDVRAQIETAKAMLDTGLPEEARKAGVPAGWLRE